MSATREKSSSRKKRESSKTSSGGSSQKKPDKALPELLTLEVDESNVLDPFKLSTSDLILNIDSISLSGLSVDPTIGSYSLNSGLYSSTRDFEKKIELLKDERILLLEGIKKSNKETVEYLEAKKNP